MKNFTIFIIHENNQKSIYARTISEIIYLSFSLLSTFYFLRLTILLPIVLAEAKNVYSDELHGNLFLYMLGILIGEKYMWNISGILILLFLISRFLFEIFQSKKLVKIWKTTINAWVGIFTILSVFAILMMG